ncbi:Transmembrane 9 superfamily member 5 [Linum perenne]
MTLHHIAAAVVLAALTFFSVGSAAPSPPLRRYNAGDDVPLFANKVGPFHNPSVKVWKFCLCWDVDRVVQKKQTLGEVLNGDRLTSAPHELKFLEKKSRVTLCERKLGLDDVLRLRRAVINDYYFQMYYDDLPLWGFVGKVEEQSWLPGGDDERLKYYLFKHLMFDVVYNGDQVIEITAIGDPTDAVDITEDVEIDVKFVYSVSWNETSAVSQSRMDRYTRASLVSVHRQIHWFSFINSIVSLLLLMGLLVVFFLRRLKNDLRRWSSNGDEEEDKEVGWKYIHGDVFRHPQNMSLFCAVLATGAQLLTMFFLLFILAFVDVLYPYSRGGLYTACVFVYALTSVVGGYTSASFHSQFEVTGWGKSVFLTGILYLGPLFTVMSFLNTVAVSYGATAGLPFGTIMVIVLICVFLAFPLLILGGIIGYTFRSEFQAPSPPKRHPREIPGMGWYRRTPSQMLLAGLLPTSAVALELHSLYTSLWGYKIYTLPSILFVTFIILCLLTAILSIGMTYIQLSVEDHRWWWRSVLRGGSPAIFMYLYSIFFFSRSSMSGVLQTSFFFGYSACLCYAVFLMLGTVSFCASFIFVCRIYRAVKNE